MRFKLSPKGKKYTEALILVCTAIATYFFWDSFFLYPIKLFVVLLHESTHAIAAFVSGGSVKGIEINYAVGGSCIVKGGNQFAIAISGYLGSLLWGGLLFISAKKFKFSKYYCWFLSAGMLFLIIFLIKDLFGIFFTLGFAIILALSPLVFPFIVHSYLLKILGMISCLYTIIDIKEDLVTTEYHISDAQILSQATSVPAVAWGIIIMTVAIIIFYYLLKFNFKNRETK